MTGGLENELTPFDALLTDFLNRAPGPLDEDLTMVKLYRPAAENGGRSMTTNRPDRLPEVYDANAAEPARTQNTVVMAGYMIHSRIDERASPGLARRCAACQPSRIRRLGRSTI